MEIREETSLKPYPVGAVSSEGWSWTSIYDRPTIDQALISVCVERISHPLRDRYTGLPLGWGGTSTWATLTPGENAE